MAQFFLACNIGLEDVLEKELKQVFPYLVGNDGRPQTCGYTITSREKGGIELETELEVGLQLNYFLKTCGRILFRLADDKMVEFYHLEAWLKKNHPKKFVGEQKFNFEVAASKSKLGHEKRLEQTLEKAFGKSQEAGQSLFLRLFEDRAHLSLDTSGEHLHFRGYRQEQGAAPLRETLAAAMLFQFCEGFSLSQLEKVNLLDPFCGSGTLLIEAATLFKPNELRHYSFQSWQKLPALLRSESFTKNYRGFEMLQWKSLLGQDVNAEVIQKAVANAKRAGVKIELRKGDSLEVSAFKEQPLWIISNPPYGERVQGQSDQNEALIVKTLKKYKPQRAGFLVPESWNLKCEGYQVTQAQCFKNGGLPVKFLIFEVL